MDFERQFREFIDSTHDSREDQLRDREYVDGKQWTAAQKAKLATRGGAPVVINRIKPKHDFLLGMERQTRTDPKAFPRTPDHEDDAAAITDALRYVADNARLDQLASACVDELICEGAEAAIVEMTKGGEIALRRVPWNSFYYDPHSQESDFSDASYMGISKWFYEDEAIALLPDHEDDIKNLSHQHVGDTAFEDRPLWLDRKQVSRPRIRINEHYFKKDGIWHLVFFSNKTDLGDAEPVPFLDYDDEESPALPIVAGSAYVDTENNRYGLTRMLIDIQNEINHRRSKALHLLSNVTVIYDENAGIKSEATLLNKLSTGKAAIKVNPGARMEIDHNQELGQGQLALLQEAKSEIDNVGVNATLAGKDERSLSGRAIQAKQAGGNVEITPILDNHADWKRRIYRQIWFRIKQFWDKERWVRVTDNDENVKFVGLNQQITARQMLAENLGVEPEQVEQALQQQGVALGPGELDRIVDVKNEVSKIDVDIIVADAPDTITLQAETFEQLIQLAQAYGPEAVPFEDIIKASPLKPSVKDDILRGKDGEQEQARAQQAQMLQAKQQQDAQVQQAKMAKDMASARSLNANADQINIESQLALQGRERIG